jgi:hypothetical protein
VPKEDKNVVKENVSVSRQLLASARSRTTRTRTTKFGGYVRSCVLNVNAERDSEPNFCAC